MPDRQPTDLVVVLPGITGSTLYVDEKPVWEPSAGAVLGALFTLGHNLKSLALPPGIRDEAPPNNRVSARALVGDVHVIPGIWTPVKGYTTLLDRLRSLGYREPTPDRPGNLLPMPYDWRLSNRYTASWMEPKIRAELERWQQQGPPYEDAEVTFVCHSMGGLVARWYAVHEGADHTGKIITFGTPMRGAMNALDQLVNGASPKLGPLQPIISKLGRTMPSLHQLLPSYACVVDATGGAPTHIDPAAVPNGDREMIADGLAFYSELEAAEDQQPARAKLLHAIVGINQPTQSTVRFTKTDMKTYPTYGKDDFQGDATVALVGAAPNKVALNSSTLRRICDYHGSLHRNLAALDEMEGVLTATDIVVRGTTRTPLSVVVPPLVPAGEPLQVQVSVPPGKRPGLHVTLRPAESLAKGTTQVLRLQGNTATASFEDLAPGAYVVDVSGAEGSSVNAVSAPTLVFAPTAEMLAGFRADA